MKSKKNILLVYLSLKNLEKYEANKIKNLKLSKNYYENELLPPLGLMYLSSSLKTVGFKTTIYDERIDKNSNQGIEKIIKIADKEKSMFK